MKRKKIDNGDIATDMLINTAASFVGYAVDRVLAQLPLSGTFRGILLTSAGMVYAYQTVAINNHNNGLSESKTLGPAKDERVRINHGYRNSLAAGLMVQGATTFVSSLKQPAQNRGGT